MAETPQEALLSEALRADAPGPHLPKRLFIFGIGGFTGRRLARFCATALAGEFTHVAGTTRTRSGAPSELPYDEFVLEPDGSLPPPAVRALEQATHVLSTVPTASDATLDDGRVERLAKQGQLVWAGYLSTTAAYGDRKGAVVTEADDVPLDALSARGKERVLQEERWLRTGAPVHVFRLPGIYGPGRGPLAKCREPSKRLIYKEGQVFCRIHVDDIIQALVLSMRRPSPGRVYNVCDDEPAAGHEVSLFAYELLGKQPPPLVRFEDVQAELSPMLKSFYTECKRVSNERAKRELGFCCIYSTFREGFAAQFDEEQREGFAPVVVSSASAASNAPRRAKTEPSTAVLGAMTIIRAVYVAMKQIRGKVVKIFRWSWLLYARHVLGIAVILVDNGSIRPGATLGMRRLAAKLSDRWGGMVVHATSWRHADRIDADKDLGGQRVLLFTPTLEKYSMGGAEPVNGSQHAPEQIDSRARFVVTVPLFLGPSMVVTREIPNQLSRGTQIVAKQLVLVRDNEENDCLITKMLLRALRDATSKETFDKSTKVLLVDHGSPSAEVTQVRRALGARLRALVYPARVVDCSMERREGAKYDFNEPTLERAFEQSGFVAERGEIVLLPAFLFAGNHAGPDGDVEQIVNAAKAKYPNILVKTARLLLDEENDDFAVELLDRRIRKALL